MKFSIEQNKSYFKYCWVKQWNQGVLLQVKIYGGTHSVIVTILENGHGDPSLNSGQSY